MSRRKRIAWPVLAALAGSGGLTLLYFVIVSLAESPDHALTLFWEDRWIVLPIILGFGIQAALYIVLKKQLYLPVAQTAPSTALTGASGGTSTMAMVACCAHHVSEVLPILGFTAAATFLAEYRVPFMLVGLGMTGVGIAVMLFTLWRERRRVMQRFVLSTEAA